MKKWINDNVYVITIYLWIGIFVMNIFILEPIGILMLFLSTVVIVTSQLTIIDLEKKK
jgi:hypothetical protein